MAKVIAKGNSKVVEPKNNNKKISRRRIEFSVKGTPNQVIMVAGSFNDWKPEKQFTYNAQKGEYKLAMLLSPGTYEYKYVIDGDWKCDEENPNIASNDFGTLNSILIVEEK